MEMLNVVKHFQRLELLRIRLDEIQKSFYRCKFIDSEIKRIEREIKQVFNSYNLESKFDILNVKMSFDEYEGRVSLNITQQSYMYCLPPYLILK